MRIKDLPKDLKKLALENQYKQYGECDKNKLLSVAFNWYETPEGYNYWLDVWNKYDNLPIEEPGKPTQYKIGIDTFERAKANLTKEELLACCRFNIDKYTWRKKDQDKSDFEKIIAYANYAIENGF